MVPAPSHPLQPLLGPEHRLHQRVRRLLLHRHPQDLPHRLRLDPGPLALPAQRDRVVRQGAAGERGHRPVQDEGHRPDGLQGRLGGLPAGLLVSGRMTKDPTL